MAIAIVAIGECQRRVGGRGFGWSYRDRRLSAEGRL